MFDYSLLPVFTWSSPKLFFHFFFSMEWIYQYKTLHMSSLQCWIIKLILLLIYLKYFGYFSFFKFCARQISETKRSRHKTFIDDIHLTKDLLYRFHFVNCHFRLWLEGLNQIEFLIELNVFSLPVLASPIKKHTLGIYTSRTNFIFIEQSYLYFFGPETKKNAVSDLAETWTKLGVNKDLRI